MAAPTFTRPIQGSPPNQFVENAQDVAALNAALEQLYLAVAAGAPENRVQEIVAAIERLQKDADRAEAARDGALQAAGSQGYFATVAEAEAALTDDDAFWTLQGSGANSEIVYYQIVSGSAVEIPGARMKASPFFQGLTRTQGGLHYPVLHEDGLVVSGYSDDGAFNVEQTVVAGMRTVAVEHPLFAYAIAHEDGVIVAGLTKDGQWITEGSGGSGGANPHSVLAVFAEPWEDPSESLMITWVSDRQDATIMEYRPAGGGQYMSTASVRTRSFPALSGLYLHTARIVGLAFDTVYECRFPGAAIVETIKTSPRRDIRVAVISDFQSNRYADEAATIGGLVTSRGHDLLLIPGDHVSDDGRIDVTYSTRWLNYLQMLQQHYRTSGGALMPSVFLIGNHEGSNDQGSGTAEAGGNGIIGQIDQICSWSYYDDHPTRYHNSAATLSVGSELFVIGIETDHTEELPGEQTDWLIDQIAEAYPKYRQILVLGHAPAFYGGPGSRHTRNTQARHIRNIIYPALEPYADKIGCYMCGHTHIMGATDRFRIDYDDQLSLSDNDPRWLVDATNGVRQLGCGPVQATTLRTLFRVEDQSALDSSEMFIAAVGLDPSDDETLVSHGQASSSFGSIYHYWTLEIDGHEFRATATDETGVDIWSMSETLPAYQ